MDPTSYVIDEIVDLIEVAALVNGILSKCWMMQKLKDNLTMAKANVSVSERVITFEVAEVNWMS